MNNPISQCKATVEMSLEQIVDIEKAFTRVQELELEQEAHDIKLQLATAKEDLRIICKSIWIASGNVAYFNMPDDTSENEALLLAIKRNQNV